MTCKRSLFPVPSFVLAMRFLPFILLCVLSAGSMAWEGVEETAVQGVPVTEEPHHIVRFCSDRWQAGAFPLLRR
jgi:hypothetical protein